MKPTKYRQAVISVFKSLGGGKFDAKATAEIIFRQAYNNLGLGMSFSFKLDYWQPFATVEASIINPSNDIVDAFYFDPKTYKDRPLVEIRAGYTTTQIYKQSEVDKLKAALPKQYTGHPIMSKDMKTVGGRTFSFQLSDIQASSRSARVGKQYKAGRTIISMLEDLVKIAGMKADFTALKSDAAFTGFKLKNKLFYNNRQIISQVLPELAKLYNFTFFAEAGVYVFKIANAHGPAGALAEINSSTGMIEHPTAINWVHWSVKTLYGQPEGVRRGGWAKIKSRAFSKLTKAVGPTKPTDNTLTALIVSEQHTFNDAEASIEFIVSPDGQPINATPVLTL